MAQDCAASLQVCAMRVAVLGADGVPLPGANNLYVSGSLVKLTAKAVVSTGEDFELKNGCGLLCVTYKTQDMLKRVEFDMEICDPDPTLTAMLVGGSVITSSGSNIGWAAPHIGVNPNPYGVSIEAWTKAVINGRQDSALPWWRWVFPRTYWMIGDKNMENAVMTNPLVGYGEENPNFEDGPTGDWAYTSDRCYMYARDTTIPTTSCGAQVLVAS